MGTRWHDLNSLFMIPISPDRIAQLLVENSDAVLTEATQRHEINGFAYVFEVGQPEPVFLFAINTKANGPADPSTGEWNYPAGFKGGNMSSDFKDCYRKLDAYMADDESSEERLREIHAVFCAAMKTTRKRWIAKLPGCLFTVNECNESNQAIQKTCQEINEVPPEPSQ